MNRKNLIKTLIYLCTLSLMLSSASAQDKDPESARRTLDELRARYSKLNTYSMTMHRQFSSDQHKPDSLVTQFFFRHPNRFSTYTKLPQGGTMIQVSNGNTLYYFLSPLNKTKYFTWPMPPESLGRIGILQYQSPYFFAPILAGVDPFAPPWGEAPYSIAWGRSSKLNGASVDSIVVRMAGDGNETRTYFIGREDGLLHRITHTGGRDKGAYSFTETYQEVRHNPKIPLEKFAFVPPANTQHGDEIKEHHSHLQHLKAGATPPALQGSDLKGQPIRLEDYKGKVVLLDFWATWCGPCLVQIPHLKAAYDKFHDQGFEIIGISFDKERAALEKYIVQNHMPWPQVLDGKMHQSEVAKEYQVRAIPFTLLIGRDGKIAAFDPKTLLLEPAIEKALAAPAP